MRDSIVFYLNGERQEIRGERAFSSLTDELRYRKRMTGTKVVCAEGDCGACTVLIATPAEPDRLRSMNACIAFLFQLDGCHVVTVEGFAKGAELHPAQKSMIENFGAQCGFCTPGFIGSMACLAENAKREGFTIDAKRAKNELTGNLCRCTGYQPIIDACVKMDLAKFAGLAARYLTKESVQDLASLRGRSVKIQDGKRELSLPASLSEAKKLRAEIPDLRISAGNTDLGVVINKNRYDWSRLMSLQNIAELAAIRDEGSHFWIGARASLDQVEAALSPHFPEFGKLLHIFASPQIKNTATLVGNVLNASPIGDTPPFLMAVDASVVIEGPQATRRVPLKDFYVGYKKLAMQPDEFVSAIEVPKTADRICLYKTSVRKDLDISAVTFAAAVQLQGSKIAQIRVAVGGVGPTVKRAGEVEDLLRGRDWSEKTFFEARDLLRRVIAPQSDVRGSKDYRLQVAGNLIMKMYFEKGLEWGLLKSAEAPSWR